MDLAHFQNKHKGETCLLVGNGDNLRLTPPEWFDYPAFGMNTIHFYEGWKPDYYVAVDASMRENYGDQVYAKYKDIPKFIPLPGLDLWKGDNFYRFLFRPEPLWPPGLLHRDGMNYSNVMTAAMLIAYFMGFATMLIIGMEHKPGTWKRHFWGMDNNMPDDDQPVQDWLKAYKIIVNGMAEQGIKTLNISEGTYVSETIIPRGDWRKYAKSEILAGLPG